MVRMPRAGLARPAAVATALAMGGALLVGCNGSDAPTTSTSSTSSAPSSSSSSTTSTSPSPSSSSPTTPAYVPVKPTFPAEAKKQTDAGAVAFVNYYWEAVNYAWTMPDDAILKQLSASGCGTCRNLEASASRFVDNGEHFSSPPMIATIPKLVYMVGDEAQVVLKVQRKDATLVDARGHIVTGNEDGPVVDRSVKLQWNGQWAVTAIGEE